jgi:hypothetical protein
MLCPIGKKETDITLYGAALESTCPRVVSTFDRIVVPIGKKETDITLYGAALFKILGLNLVQGNPFKIFVFRCFSRP